MTEQKGPADQAANTPQELSEAQLVEATGGFNPQPDPPKVAAQQHAVNIGAQSTGAGAGKVTFNPF